MTSRKITLIALIATVIALCMDLSTQDNCHENMYTNGCTIPMDVPFPFSKTAFLPACDKHDVCYRCGSLYGKTRRYCDKEFKRNLKRICDDSWLLRLKGCSLFIHLYYAGVRVGGVGRFEHTPRLGCDDSWVRNCI